MNFLNPTICLTACVLLGACAEKPAAPKSGLDPKAFEAEYDGKRLALYTLRNFNGMEVDITNLGGRIASIMVPDRDGEFRDVVLGFDSIAAYFPENNKSDFGAAIGRYANRIAGGRFVLDGDTVVLPQNNFGHCLHGGPTGWQYKVYDVVAANDTTLQLSITSPDGDNGFPGTVKATVTYTLRSDNSLAIHYTAVTDKPTVINMTNHTYFNLSGDPACPVTDEELTINASRFTPVDSTFMTTGEILPVEGTPMDFTKAKAIGAEIGMVDYEQIANGNGYDHNWVLDTNGDLSVPAATLLSPASGIKLTVYTTEPGIQVYTGNFLDGTVTGKRSTVYNRRSAICLETQKYPDTPNKPQWPSAELRPGGNYGSTTVFKFSTF
ncbi:aldose epimerase family protein [uncultured Muribaculum sp.]|uniref:aldose epimerase family protein n=1 Tax=uncultured Muribaculum sp. TaxID=1918613 RepID=UPI0025DEDC29|nr:aldose epimerase family protein [uncultured Muribaculum sp.]